MLSNIAGGTPDQCRLIVDRGFVSPLCSLLMLSDFDVKREVAHVLFNIAFKEPVGRIPKLVANRGVVSNMTMLIGADDVAMIALGTRFAKLVLEFCKDGQARVEEANGIELLENLQYKSVPPELCAEAKVLLDTYFGEDYGDEEDEDTSTSDVRGNLAGFGTAPVAFEGHSGYFGSDANQAIASSTPAGRGRGAHLTMPAWAARPANGARSAPKPTRTLFDFGFGGNGGP